MNMLPLLAPLTELFPELNMSYFVPPCSDNTYDNYTIFRIIVIILVWGTLSNELYKIDKTTTPFIVMLLLISFSSRLYKEWHTKYKYLSYCHLFAFLLIIKITKNMELNVTLIIIGGFLMNIGRKNDLYIDILGRILFSMGFMMFSSKLLNYSKNETILSYILIVTLIVLILFGINNTNKSTYISNSENISYIDSLTQKEFISNKYNSRSCDYSKYLFVEYDELEYYSDRYHNKIFSNIPNNRIISNKSQIWETLKNNNSQHITPFTFILPNEYEEYKKSCGSKKFIFKNNKQQQKGLKLVDKCESLEISNEYLVAQIYMLDPYLYKGHKINIRLYMIINVNSKGIFGYVSDDGIVSYTKNIYNEYTIDPNSNIASFYDSRKLYDDNFPITLNEFENYEIYFKCVELTKQLFDSYRNAMKDYVVKNENSYYEIFGIDYFVDSKENPLILEVNSGPGMTPYGKKDKIMRDRVIENYFYIMTNNNINYVKL
jgi:hypothetical protein